MRTTTRTLLTESLPRLAALPGHSLSAVANEFATYRQAVEEAACHRGAKESNFDWDEAQAIILENNQRGAAPHRGQRIVAAAARTAIFYDGREVPLHSPHGVFLATDDKGRPIAGTYWRNPEVPESYGHPDFYALFKLGGAIAIEKCSRQGADWGRGYQAWTELLHEAAPTIGMATLHQAAYSSVSPGADRRALTYAGTTHRALSPSFRQILDTDPAFTALSRPANDSDFLAGWLDSRSSYAAIDAGVNSEDRTLAYRPIVAMPWVVSLDVLDVKYAGVNLN